MGKISFPLENVRKDVAGQWHLKHFSGDTAEEFTVPIAANENGFHTIYLTEVPDAGTNTDLLSTTPPKISGLVEFRGSPLDSKTKRLNLSPVQFFVNYQTGEILFHPAQAGKTFRIDYFGKGSLIEADDVNYLHKRITDLEKEHDLSEFTKFEIVGLENSILEVGESLPKEGQSNLVEFKWETTFPDRVKDGSIKIENLTSGQVIGDNLSNTGTYSVEFQETFLFVSPNSIKFKISALGLNEDPIERILTLEWVDRFYWGVSPHKLISGDQIKTFLGKRLFPNIAAKQKETILMMESLQHFKVIATPKRYPLKKVIDKETSLSFIFDQPREILFVNSAGVSTSYLIYCSTYPIASEVELICEFGE